MIARLLRNWAFKRTLERNLRARKAARQSGLTYVSGYTRRAR